MKFGLIYKSPVIIFIFVGFFSQIAFAQEATQLKSGRYMCELARDLDGKQNSHCITPKGKKIPCIGQAMILTEDSWFVDRPDRNFESVKIAENEGSEQQKTSMVFTLKSLQTQSTVDYLTIINFSYGQPDIIHVYNIHRYGDSAYSVSKPEHRSDPYRYYMHYTFQVCQFIGEN